MVTGQLAGQYKYSTSLTGRRHCLKEALPVGGPIKSYFARSCWMLGLLEGVWQSSCWRPTLVEGRPGRAWSCRKPTCQSPTRRGRPHLPEGSPAGERPVRGWVLWRTSYCYRRSWTWRWLYSRSRPAEGRLCGGRLRQRTAPKRGPPC